ncbi:hypothetical protein BS47DRAFT_1346453 [Hydnum rufescens UP504]|uniref:Uncharacterized protein n=1 Tax=Hydnum rufescens UP504 TaxID=1448309 RepID=A0A9P6AUJ4_9AGAM|nr:hypothetical protein BS47DRAFT_1346453 [Hydnum rufescens UP504]
MPRFDISLVQVANTFGPAICCPRDGLSYLRGEGVFAEDKITLEDSLEHGSQEYVAKISKELLLWLLLYWDQIADGLLEDEVEDDLRKFVDGLGDGDDHDDSDEDDDISFIYQPPPYLPGRTVSVTSVSPSMLSSSYSPLHSLFPSEYHMGNLGQKGTK